MRSFTATLGRQETQIFAPEVGACPPVEVFRAYFPSGGLYGLDVESTELTDQGPYAASWRLRTIQVATETYAWVLNVADPDQRAAAADLLSDPTVRFTSHSQIDPIAVDVALGVDITGRFIDTYFLTVMCSPDDRDGGNELKPHVTKRIGPQLQAAEAELDQEFRRLYHDAHPYKLDELGNPIQNKNGSFRKAPKPSDKAVKAFGFTNVDIDNPAYLVYGGLDAVAVRRLAPALAAETRAPQVLLQNETWLSQQSAKISRRGHRLDVGALETLMGQTRTRAAELEAAVGEATGGLTPRQNVELVKFFAREGVDFSSHPKTDKGAPSLSKDHADLLLGYPMSEAGRAAAEAFVAYAKILNRLTITESIANRMVDGRIHPTLKTVGTVTGRMSSSGPNMQNFAKKDAAMRGLFIPEDDCVLMSCDFAQIELRVLAALAGERRMIEAIMADDDLHQLTADLLGITRQEAKTVNFLIVYGGGGAKLAKQLGFPKDQDRDAWISRCYDVIKTYWKQYPAITDYKRRVEQLSEVELISGRKVPVANGRTYANLNYKIQGSARELLAGAWRRFGRTEELAAMVWMPIHDEIVLQVPEDRAEEIGAEVQGCMTFPFRGVPVAADPDVLLDENGVSRWMSGDHAREMACVRRGHHLGDGPKCTYCGEKMLIAA